MTVTAILALGYAYLAVRLTTNVWQRVGLVLPFVLVWHIHATVTKGAARMHVGGVLDPALQWSNPASGPRPDLAVQGGKTASFRLLLAHNPKIAALAERAGFDLQLSGHTHAGQFFPWTLAVRLVHAPHVAGLSREGRMWVYVSAGPEHGAHPCASGPNPSSR